MGTRRPTGGSKQPVAKTEPRGRQLSETSLVSVQGGAVRLLSDDEVEQVERSEKRKAPPLDQNGNASAAEKPDQTDALAPEALEALKRDGQRRRQHQGRATGARPPPAAPLTDSFDAEVSPRPTASRASTGRRALADSVVPPPAPRARPSVPPPAVPPPAVPPPAVPPPPESASPVEAALQPIEAADLFGDRSHQSGALQPGDTVADRYRIVGSLGQGGMAEVYLAEQVGVAGVTKSIVIKRILPSLVRDQKFVDLFVREAHVASSLMHTNVVQLYELGQDRGTYFIAMEYVRGLSLMDLAERSWKLRLPLPIETILLAAADAAQGLHYGWRTLGPDGKPLGLVHRDVSPDNLMLSTDGTTKVLDFGIAKSASSADLTQAGELKGKLCYIPPEQFSGAHLDHRSDLYALGVSLYTLLTGDVPFDVQAPMDLLDKVVKGVALKPSIANLEIPAIVDDLVMWLLEKQPDRRPQDGSEFVAAVTDLLRTEARRPKSAELVEALLGRGMEVDDIDVIPRDIVKARPRSDCFEEAMKRGQQPWRTSGRRKGLRGLFKRRS